MKSKCYCLDGIYTQAELQSDVVQAGDADIGVLTAALGADDDEPPLPTNIRPYREVQSKP